MVHTNLVIKRGDRKYATRRNPQRLIQAKKFDVVETAYLANYSPSIVTPPAAMYSACNTSSALVINDGRYYLEEAPMKGHTPAVQLYLEPNSSVMRPLFQAPYLRLGARVTCSNGREMK